MGKKKKRQKRHKTMLQLIIHAGTIKMLDIFPCSVKIYFLISSINSLEFSS